MLSTFYAISLCVYHFNRVSCVPAFLAYQVSEKILNKKELEFYKWDGNLTQLLQNVRDKLNQVASVSPRNQTLHLLSSALKADQITFNEMVISVPYTSSAELVPGGEGPLPGGDGEVIHLLRTAPPPHIHMI